MGVYDRYVLPRLLDCTCGQEAVRDQRAKVVPLAQGRVLELGIGSGLNLPLYDPARVVRVIGVDPAPEMLARARRRADGLAFTVELLDADAATARVEPASVDTVVVTYSLCTIPDGVAALEIARRALRPGGRLLFCEHGRSAEPGVARWQERITPVWKRIAGGCRLDRDVPAMLAAGGFAVDRLETFYMPRAPRPMGWHFLGSAVAR